VKIASRNYTWIIAFVLGLLVFFAVAKTCIAGISRPCQGSRTCLCDADFVAAFAHHFILRHYEAVALLPCSSKVVIKQLPSIFNPTTRGPPVLL
jgi:hypothetical protein